MPGRLSKAAHTIGLENDHEARIVGLSGHAPDICHEISEDIMRYDDQIDGIHSVPIGSGDEPRVDAESG